MDTVRLLMARLKAEEISIDEALDRLRALRHQPSKRASGLAESYRRADDMPDDNDTFWIDLAYTQRVIKYDVYHKMIEELAARPHADNPVAAISEVAVGALRVAGGALVGIADKLEPGHR